MHNFVYTFVLSTHKKQTSSQHGTHVTGELMWHTIMNPIITLLLEEDVVLLPEPAVGQVARVGFRLAGEEGVLRNVHCNVLWW